MAEDLKRVKKNVGLKKLKAKRAASALKGPVGKLSAKDLASLRGAKGKFSAAEMALLRRSRRA